MNKNFERKILLIISYSSVLNICFEMVLLSTHNICFG